MIYHISCLVSITINAACDCSSKTLVIKSMYISTARFNMYITFALHVCKCGHVWRECFLSAWSQIVAARIILRLLCLLYTYLRLIMHMHMIFCPLRPHALSQTHQLYTYEYPMVCSTLTSYVICIRSNYWEYKGINKHQARRKKGQCAVRSPYEASLQTARGRDSSSWLRSI